MLICLKSQVGCRQMPFICCRIVGNCQIEHHFKLAMEGVFHSNQETMFGHQRY